MLTMAEGNMLQGQLLDQLRQAAMMQRGQSLFRSIIEGGGMKYITPVAGQMPTQEIIPVSQVEGMMHINRPMQMPVNQENIPVIPNEGTTHITPIAEQGPTLNISEGSNNNSSYEDWKFERENTNNYGGDINYYHGRRGDIVFDDSRPAFFAKSKRGAEWYSKERGNGEPNILETRLDINKPFKLYNKEDAFNFIGLLNRAGLNIQPTIHKDGGWTIPEEQTKPIREHSDNYGENLFDWLYVPKVRDQLKKEGYDSVTGWDILENGEIDIAIPLSSSQIKQNQQLKYKDITGRLDEQELLSLKDEYIQSTIVASDSSRSNGVQSRDYGSHPKFTQKGFVQWLNSGNATKGYNDEGYLSLVSKARGNINTPIEESRPMNNYSLTPEYTQELKNEVQQIQANAQATAENPENNPRFTPAVAALEFQDELNSHPELYNFNPDKKFFEANSEYIASTDPDLLCQRSEGCDLGVKLMKEELGDKYNNSLAWELVRRAREESLKSPCPQCYVYSARAGKAEQQKRVLEGVGGYEGEIQKGGGFFTPSKIETYKKRSFRNYSSTDFKPEHLPGMIMKIVDSSEKGIPEGAYTKVGDFARIFAPAGVKINLSIGRDNVVGMDYDEAVELRNQYPTVGTVYVAFSDAEVEKALENENVDHVIPWHGSGQAKSKMQEQLNDKDIKDFTREQSEKIKNADGRLVNAPKDIKIKDYEHMGNKEKYLALCKERGLIPKFKEYIDHPNYMKLIGMEYGKINDPQPLSPVTAKFDYDAAKKVMKNWVKNKTINNSAYLNIARDIIKENKKPSK